MRRTVDQHGCRFEPRVTVIPAGGSVTFVNSDPVLHNVKGDSLGASFNFAVSQDTGRTVAFSEPGFVAVGCSIHTWMNATIVVANNPWFAITDERGRFALDDVPEGDWTLVVWHEVLGKIDKRGRRITVRRGEEARIDLAFE